MANPNRTTGCFCLILTLVVTLLGLAGCTEDSVSTSPGLDEPAEEVELDATLELVPAGEIDGQWAVDLFFTKDPERPGPRMMELFVRPSDGLDLHSSAALSATTAAGKQLVVQTQEDGTIRVIVFATDNVNRLESGPLARLAFSKGGGAATLELLDRRPLFAPAEADFGTTLGESLTLGGN